MARLRRSNLLTCFYCGKRSSTPYDGTTRQFLCLYCDATNHLDENGEITDPPVATEREPPAPQFTTKRPPQPSPDTTPSPSNDIFCATCLKNQRLFTASLAQYLPDDPSDPTYEELERNYYKFRRSLEKRYPQVCGDCAERVERRIHEAGYTAKTDHLRKMMARSRARPAERRLTPLDWVERLGRGLWWAGIVLQMIWHLKMASTILAISEANDGGMVDPDAASSNYARQISERLGSLLPDATFLISASITSAILSVWWNPQFVQVSRGFSRHLMGFRQWYSFQGLIIFFRVIFRRLAEVDTTTSRGVSALLIPHAVMAGLMTLMVTTARRSIKVDTTPLFGPTSAPSSPLRAPNPTEMRREDQQSLSSILDEVLDSPAPQRQPTTARQVELNRLPNPQPPPAPFTTPKVVPHHHRPFGTPESKLQAGEDPDVMDWTPTQSQHRAFSSAPIAGSVTRPFGQSPVEPASGAFWYKVPPAPTAPAQRLRNPPNVPILRSKPTEVESVYFRKKSEDGSQSSSQSHDVPVEFKQPKFFAPVKDDERSSLADMLNKSFTLGHEVDEVNWQTAPPKKGQMGVASKTHRPMSRASLTNPVTLGAFLLIWVLTAIVQVPYENEIRLSALIGAGVVAMSDMGDTTQQIAGEQPPFLASIVLPIVDVFELTALCWVGWQIWTGDGDVSLHGVGILGFGSVKRLAQTVWRRRLLA